MTPRLPDWRPRLTSVVESYDGRKFKWGESDCAHWGADCVLAVTGVDVLGTLRGSWHSRMSCAARLLARGYRSNEQAVAGLLATIGSQEISMADARYGDVGITPCGAIAVRLQPGFLVRDNDGRFGRARIARIWSVGERCQKF